MQVRLYILHTSCRLLMQAHWVLSNITSKLVCQTKIMGTVSTFMTFQKFVSPVQKMNKSSLAFTAKLNQERFSANLTSNWSSAVYLKLTIGKRFNLVCVWLLRLYLLCDNDDVRYFRCVREDTVLALFKFYKYKDVPV